MIPVAPAPTAASIFTPRQLAGYTGLSESFFAKLRMAENRHRGPAFVKIGKAVMYRRVDVDAWLASHLVEAA
jgi:predicted DNA-binding transcriptional regulator AlpA